jgi:hypothetical protein
MSGSADHDGTASQATEVGAGTDAGTDAVSWIGVLPPWPKPVAVDRRSRMVVAELRGPPTGSNGGSESGTGAR